MAAAHLAGASAMSINATPQGIVISWPHPTLTRIELEQLLGYSTAAPSRWEPCGRWWLESIIPLTNRPKELSNKKANQRR